MEGSELGGQGRASAPGSDPRAERHPGRERAIRQWGLSWGVLSERGGRPRRGARGGGRVSRKGGMGKEVVPARSLVTYLFPENMGPRIT